MYSKYTSMYVCHMPCMYVCMYICMYVCVNPHTHTHQESRILTSRTSQQNPGYQESPKTARSRPRTPWVYVETRMEHVLTGTPREYCPSYTVEARITTGPILFLGSEVLYHNYSMIYTRPTNPSLIVKEAVYHDYAMIYTPKTNYSKYERTLT